MDTYLRYPRNKMDSWSSMYTEKLQYLHSLLLWPSSRLQYLQALAMEMRHHYSLWDRSGSRSIPYGRKKPVYSTQSILWWLMTWWQNRVEWTVGHLCIKKHHNIFIGYFDGWVQYYVISNVCSSCSSSPSIIIRRVANNLYLCFHKEPNCIGLRISK